MQNNFLPKHILPKCFKSFFARIFMEAIAKENFYQKIGFRFHFPHIRFHYTLFYGNIQQKMKIFLPEKK